MIAAIIQARMGSTRLPGKVLMQVNGKALLGIQVTRVSKAKLLDKVIVATSTSLEDEVIVSFCRENAIECFRGPEDDVLSRYYECAKKYAADIIVRLTADCPLSDPELIDRTIKLYQDGHVDYAANAVPPETSKYADGSDVEVFGIKALERAYREAKDPHDREHVTFYFWKYNNGFKLAQLGNDKDYSKYRFTVDYPEDFEVVKFLTETLEKENKFGRLDEIIELLDLNPQVRKLNSKYYFGIGWKK